MNRFLGILGYYRSFTKNFLKFTKPLTEYLKKVEADHKYLTCLETFENLLTNNPISRFLNFSNPLILP